MMASPVFKLKNLYYFCGKKRQDYSTHVFSYKK